MKAKKIFSLALSSLLVMSVMNFAPSAQSVTATDEPIKILCIGDSLTEGSIYRDGNYYDESGAWRKQLASRLNADGLNFEFTGVNYTNNANMLEKDRWHCAKGGYSIGPDGNSIGNADNELTRYLNCDADIILLMIGRNEYVGMSGVDSALSTDHYYDLVNRIFAAKPNVKLFAASIPPLKAYDRVNQGDFDTGDAAIWGLNKTVPQIVKSYRDQGYDMYSMDLSAQNTGLTYDDYQSGDNVHFTSAGNDKIGNAWYSRIQPMVASLSATIDDGIDDTVIPYDGEIKNFDFANWKTYLNIDSDFEGHRTSGVLLTTGLAGDDWGTWRVGNAYNPWGDWGTAAVTDNAYRDGGKYAVDLNFSYSDGVDGKFQYWVCPSFVDDNNRLSMEFSPQGDNDDSPMIAKLVRVENGVRTELKEATFDKTAGRLRYIVNGTKLSVAVGTSVWFSDFEVGEMPAGGNLRVFSQCKLGIRRYRVYTPAAGAEPPLQVKSENYSIKFSDYYVENPSIPGWSLDGMESNSWEGYSLSSKAYGFSGMYLNSPKYSNDYSMKIRFNTGWLRTDTSDMNFRFILSDGGTNTTSADNETSIYVYPHHYTNNYQISLIQRENRKVIMEHVYIGEGWFPTGHDVSFVVENANGATTVVLKDENVETVLFKNVKMTIPAGRIGYASQWVQNYIKAIDITAINTTKSGDVNGDGDINVKDLVCIKKYLAGVQGAVIDEKASDINSDNTVNNEDLVLLRKTLLGNNIA